MTNKELLFTPEGVRDIYGEACEYRMQVQNEIHSIMKLYGFEDIQTPTFEFFDIFSPERGSVERKEMFKFFDRYNNTLVLRPDITPSIARSVAKYYKDDEMQIRLCYVGSTFANNSNNQGRLKEVTQVGAELVNDSTSDADGEMIALTIECLQKSGLKEFKVDIGHADFFNGLVEEANLSEEDLAELTNLLQNRNMFGVADFLEDKEMDKNLKDLFIKLPELFSGKKSFEFVKEMTKNERALKAVERLEKLYEILESYGLLEYATFDLGMLSHYNYYTGVIFKAYTYGTGEPIASGGRYDKMYSQFGKDASAIGVAIVLDQLMIALTRQNLLPKKEAKDVIVLYHSANRSLAILLGNKYREQGVSIRLIRKDSDRNMEDYIAHGKKNSVKEILFIENEENVHVHCLNDGTVTTKSMKEL